MSRLSACCTRISSHYAGEDGTEEHLILTQAQSCGYEGSCMEGAQKYIEEFYSEIQRISEASWRRFCRHSQEMPIDRSFYVRDFIAQETLNVSEFYSLLLGKSVYSWETLAQYLIKRLNEGSVTDYEQVSTSLKNFCFYLTKSESQKRSNDLLGRLGATMAPISWDSQEIQHLLAEAVCHGRLDIVRCFLAAGVDKPSLLSCAVEHGQLTLVEELLQDESHVDEELLFMAIEGEYETLASYLVYKGASLNKWACYGETLLTYYASKNRLRCMQILIRLGADTSARNQEDKTALMCALEQGHESISHFLLLCKKEFQDLESRALLIYYSGEGNLSVVQMLIRLGALIDHEVVELSKEPVTRFLQALLEQKQTLMELSSIAER
ncbi:MAG: hypothetical protein FJZ58_03195 [Chlamydiae bacterium]|nr:hypothetical protein [Chlamydiota bacterium]